MSSGVSNIGIDGLGKMGTKMVAYFSNLGYNIYGYDNDPSAKKIAIENLENKFRNVKILDTPSDVSRVSDITLYFVPIENMSFCIENYGRHANVNSVIVSGSSVMSAAENGYNSLPKFIDAISAHPLYGPSVNPKNQTTAVVKYKGSEESLETVKQLFGAIGNKTVELPSHADHDKIMSEVQVATHLASISYGVAVKRAELTFWRDGLFKDNMQRMKSDMMIRTFNGSPHVYSGIAMVNPFSGDVVKQYAKSANDLFSMSIYGKNEGLKNRINEIKDFVFGKIKNPIRLDDPRMGQFRLGIEGSIVEDSHLSLITQADVWYQRGVNPYDNPACQTGPYKLRLGMVEHLFTRDDLLESSLNVLMREKEAKEDLAFNASSDLMAKIILTKNKDAFNKLFHEHKEYYADGTSTAMKESDEMIERVSSYSTIDKLREKLGI